MFVTVDTSIEIQAAAETIWHYASDPKNWTASNSEEHFGLQFDTPDNLPAEGAQFHQRESVAGIFADLYGRFHYMDRPRLAVWSGTATYKKLGGLVRARVAEGGVLKLERVGERLRLSHNVYLDFPNSIWGRLVLRFFHRANGRQAVFDHTYKELVFFKNRLEDQSLKPQAVAKRAAGAGGSGR